MPDTNVENLYAKWLIERGDASIRNSDVYIREFKNYHLAGLLSNILDEEGNFDASKPLGMAVSNILEANRDIRVPAFMVPNTERDIVDFETSSRQALDALPKIDDDTILVGVIDTGIPLAHRRTCFSDDGSLKTRIVSAWQQGAAWNPARDKGLPFGAAWNASELDQLMDAHTRASGWLDEEAFNRAAGLENFRDVQGHRTLSRHDAHGAFVLDLAAGLDPRDNPDLARKIRLIVVNLPGREVVGLSGEFLDQYVAMGIAWIFTVAEALHAKADKPPKTGFPLIINFSFGKQAGPRDGSSSISLLSRSLNEARVAEGRDPATFVLPAGNDALSRANGSVELGARTSTSATRVLDWRLLPADQSNNYVEIWSQPVEDWGDGRLPLHMEVTLPDGQTLAVTEPPEPGHVDLVPDDPTPLRICLRKIPTPGTPALVRLHFLICTAPTTVVLGDAPAAPAGRWQITLSNQLDTTMLVTLNVQTDQSILPESQTGRRPYFDDKDYRRFDETTGEPVDEDSSAPSGSSWIKRRGTLNALAPPHPTIIVTAGHRATDGAPAPYSGQGDDVPYVQRAPGLSLITDRGPARPGIVSSGSRDGSATIMQGTSFAAATATRLYAMHCADRGAARLNPEGWTQPQELPNASQHRSGRRKVKTEPKDGTARFGRGRP